MDNLNRLKCYFAFSDDLENNDKYKEMLIATLESARRNTSLDLYCLYDGKDTDELYSILKRFEVNIKLVTIPFANEIYNIYTKEYMEEKFHFQISKASLRSRFLRMLLAEYETDEYVLYSDTDVIFLKDIQLQKLQSLTKTIAVCPEFERTQNYEYFNAGVMLIYIPEFKKRYQNFIKMIQEGKKATIECCDQGYLNELYKNDFDKLPLEYNWKPHWGIANPYILHLHGPKPFVFKEWEFNFFREYIRRYPEARDGWMYYFSKYTTFLSGDYSKELTNLSKFIYYASIDNSNKLRFKIFIYLKIKKFLETYNFKFKAQFLFYINKKLAKYKIYNGEFMEFENSIIN